MEQGVDFETTTKYFRYLQNRGRIKDAGVLYAMASAGLWPAERRETGPDLCLRCGLKNESEYHIIYECSKNADPCKDTIDEFGDTVEEDGVCLEDRVFKATKHLPKLAKVGVTTTPCYWLRGLLPSPWLDVPPPP